MNRRYLSQKRGFFGLIEAHFRVRSSATDEKIAEKQAKKTRFWPSNLLFIKSIKIVLQ
jgi:hypothetical protein